MLLHFGVSQESQDLFDREQLRMSRHQHLAETDTGMEQESGISATRSWFWPGLGMGGLPATWQSTPASATAPDATTVSVSITADGDNLDNVLFTRVEVHQPLLISPSLVRCLGLPPFTVPLPGRKAISPFGLLSLRLFFSLVLPAAILLHGQSRHAFLLLPLLLGDITLQQQPRPFPTPANLQQANYRPYPPDRRPRPPPTTSRDFVSILLWQPPLPLALSFSLSSLIGCDGGYLYVDQRLLPSQRPTPKHREAAGG